MNILITGITGFVGAHLADYLSNDSTDTIYGLHRSTKGESTFNALDLQHKKNVNLVLGNVNILNDTLELINDYDIDQVYHLAAQANVKNASSAPVPTYVTNILGTMNVLESVRLIEEHTHKKIPTLVQSSDKAYGTSQVLPYTEDLPLNGLDIYSSSKACQDIIARSYAYTHNLPIVVARPCNIYGEFDFNWSRIIPQLIKAYLTNSKITIYKNTSKQLREYIHIHDLVEALELLLDNNNIEKTKGQAFNISSGHVYNVDNILEIFKEVTNHKNIEYIEKDKGFKEIEQQTLDCSKIKDTIDWCPEIELNCGVFENITTNYKDWFDEFNNPKHFHSKED